MNWLTLQYISCIGYWWSKPCPQWEGNSFWSKLRLRLNQTALKSRGTSPALLLQQSPDSGWFEQGQNNLARAEIRERLTFFSGLFLKPTSTLARGAGRLLFFVSFPPADCHRASGVRRARWDVTSLCGPAFREEPRCHVASTRCQMFRKSGAGGVTKHRSLGFWWLPVKGRICIKPLLRLDAPLKNKTRIAFLLSNVFY